MSGVLDQSLVDRIIRLPPEKRVALERKLTTVAARRSRPHASDDVVTAPTSFGQRGQWFVHQLDRNNSFFNKTDAVRIRGPLEVDALSRAVSGLVARHAVLRTGFEATDDGPVQTIKPPTPFELPVVEIPGGPRQTSELHRHLAAEQRRAFDLEKGPMYRSHVIRLAPDDHVLVRTNHHIAFDRWSSAIANSELSEFYRAFAAGEEPRLEPLPYQYADFALWQRSRLDSATMKRHLEFAEAHLAGVPQVLDVPTDRPRPPGHGHQGSSYSTSLGPQLVQMVRERARAEGATPFMVCLAAFAILVGRYARTNHFLLGVPAAGRDAPGSETLIGLFINSLVMRIDLRGDPSFSELVARVRASALGVMSHRDLPFDVLVENLATQRVPGRTPMFQVMLDYINTPAAKLTLGSLDLEPVTIADEASVYDVNLYLFDNGGGIDSKWEYRSDLFDRPTIVRMSQAYETVLQAALIEPDRSVSTIPLVSPADRVRIHSIGSGPTTDPPDPGGFLRDLERHACDRPAAAAIEAGVEVISYGELMAMTMGVSQRVTSMCRSDALIAIQTDRSPQLVPALLGVLHSRRTAVMVDPGQPAHRLSSMLGQLDVAATITEGFGDQPHIEVTNAEGRAHLGASDGLDPPAYVVFTSGSTGAPRPVALGRPGLENFVADACERYAFTAYDRVLQFASTGFDTLLEEVLPTLASGATLVMRPPEMFGSFAEFSNFVRDHAVTVLDLPTAWWHAWVDEMTRTDAPVPDTVRLVIIGGEAARVDRWRTWQRLTGGRVRLVNTYGPSETTVVVATFEPPRSWSPTTDFVPIGLPIRNTRLLVVDEAGHVVPPGVPGELLVEGPAVGAGYLGETEQISGFERVDGHARYRTGDRVRVSVDGVHEFLGRLDGQVKISGIRVEPAEIEAALRGHPQVEDAVVTGVDSGDGYRLVAHLASSGTVDENEVRRHLAARLPQAMIPGSFVTHPAFPMTSSGKVDRTALRGLASDHEQDVVAPVDDRPATATEQSLTRIWATLMPHGAPRLHDDFFAVGGHSLLGVRMISQIADEFGVDLPLRVLYDAPTVSTMARWIDGLLEGSHPQGDQALHHGD